MWSELRENKELDMRYKNKLSYEYWDMSGMSFFFFPL